MDTKFELRPAVLREVEHARGCHPPTDLLTPENANVYNNMPAWHPPCLSCSPWDTVCLSNWSWDLTTCSDMLPFKVDGSVIHGVFRFVNNLSRSVGIDVGTNYTITFPEPCKYVFWLAGNAVEGGSFSYTRASHHSSSNGGGGYHRAATMELQPSEGQPWESLWVADERFSGMFQSKFGYAEFTITPVDSTTYRVTDSAHQ